MKKFLAVSAIVALGLASTSFAGGFPEETNDFPEEMRTTPTVFAAQDTGIYVGLEGGWGFTNYSDNAYYPVSVTKDNGAVGRLSIGYDISRYLATEFGYSYFSNKADLDNQGLNIKTQAIDICFKGKLPIIENFDLFAKLGAGWLFKKWTNPAAFTNYNSTTNNINVAFGAGMDYYITPNVIASAEWLRIAGCSLKNTVNVYKNMPNTDAFMIGLRYRFEM